MLKKTIAIISVFLAVFITFFAVSVVPVYAEEKAEKKRQANEEIGVNAYQKLNTYLADKNAESLTAMLSETENYDTNLAAVYAGAYINDEGNLIVNITDASKEIQEELVLATDNAPIEYKIVEKNLSELQEVYGILSAHLTEAPYFEVVLSETKNIVEVYTENDINICSAYIKNLVNLSEVEIISKKNQFTDCAKVYSGQKYTCKETGFPASVGFPCTQNVGDKKGFVTAAHTFKNFETGTTGNTVTIFHMHFGKVTASRYGVTTDAAFVEQQSSLLPPWWNLQTELPDKTKPPLQAWGTSSITPEGCTIAKYGYASLFREGKLISNSASFIINNVPFYSLAKVTTVMTNGDSGGPCMTTHNGKNTLVGIVKGVNFDTMEGYYCHLEYVMKELNITPDIP